MRVAAANTKEKASKTNTRSDAGSRAEGRSPLAEAGLTFAPPASIVALQAKMAPPAALTALQAKMAPPASLAAVQRRAHASSPSPLGRAVQREESGAGGGGEAAAIVAAAKQGTSTPGQDLPHRDVIQGAFGRHDISGVSAHLGRDATAASEAMGADAFTFGSHVAFRGAPTLHTAAHEAAHVIQQRAGVHLKDGVGRIGDVYERHADAVADRVVRGESAEALLSTFAPPDGASAPNTSAVQGAWISRQKEKTTLYRYWKQIATEPVTRVDGWYKLKDPTGAWDAQDNLEIGGSAEVANFPAEEEILPDAVVSHATRYKRDAITADPLSATAQTNIEKAKLEASKLKPELLEKVTRNGFTLAAPMKVYRWGEYQYEKNYVKNNGFKLGHVNFGSSQYGPGMYVATTPWGSAEYATEKDGTIIEVTLPVGTFCLNPSKSKDFDRTDEQELWDNPRVPQFLIVADHSGWATIKDDQIPLTIDFYQPAPQELTRVAPHLHKMTDVRGYTALQIINRQLGSPIPMPPQEKMLALFVNQPEMKRQKVQQYIQKISSFEFVPFMLSEGELNFTESVGEFLGAVTNTSRFGRHFGDVEITLRTWAEEPFSLSSSDFSEVVERPFNAALQAYKQEREAKEADPSPWYKGWGLKYATGNKLTKATQFGRRLIHFRQFLEAVDTGHSDLAATEKDSHVGVKVGRRRGLLPKTANKEARKKAIKEMMLRGVKPVGKMARPTAIIMMGLPGSGKSSVISKVAPDIENYVVADPDEAKSGMPEYQVGIKARDTKIAEKVHDESKEITSDVVEETRSTRRNLIYDTTGAGLSRDLFTNLRAAGYRIKVVYVHVALDKAKERVKERAKKSGRSVPDSVISNISYMLPGSLEAFGPIADTVHIYNNMGGEPVLAWSGARSVATRSKLHEELDKLNQ